MDELRVPKTVVICNKVLGACSKAREAYSARNILARMRKQNLAPDVTTYNSVISAFVGSSRWKEALSVLDQCYREPGVTPDLFTCTLAMR